MRRKRVLTRRQRAIKKIAFPVALLMLSVFALLLHRGYTPAHALRDSEDRSGIGATTVVEEMDLPFAKALSVRAVLSENRRGLLLSLASYDWLSGWQAVGECTTEFGGQESLCAGVVTVLSRADSTSGVVIFGQMARSICRVELEGMIRFGGIGEEYHEVRTTWERQGEETTFLFLPDWDGARSMRSFLCVGYDAQGREVARVETIRHTMLIDKSGIGVSI